MSAVAEPDYTEVFEDLRYYQEHSTWPQGVPDWAFAFARQLGVQVAHPAVLYEGWKFVAERAMLQLHPIRKAYVSPDGDPMDTVRRIQELIDRGES